MASLLCIPQFIALNFQAHTFASGHCWLRHARGRGALILPSMPPWKCSPCKWLLLFCFFTQSRVKVAQLQACVSSVGAVRDVWLSSVGVAHLASCLLNRLWSGFLAGDWLLETQQRTLKDLFTGPHQIYPVFNCIGEQSLSALQILGKAELYNRAIIAGV